MITKGFLFICLSMLKYLLPICCSVTERAATSGPFKSTLVDIKDCSNPSKPYLKNPSLTYLVSIHNINGKDFVDGNFTVFKNTNNFKIKFRRLVWRDGKWVQSYLLNQIDCHGSLLHITLLAINIKYDKKTCTFLKGSYSMKNMDVNKMQHIWASTLQYGRTINGDQKSLQKVECISVKSSLVWLNLFKYIHVEKCSAMFNCLKPAI